MARVCVLGPVELVDPDGVPVTLAPRIRPLLAALAVRAGDVASVDGLPDAVWGDEASEHPDNAVQTLVSRLRTSIRSAGGGSHVLTRPEGTRCWPPPSNDWAPSSDLRRATCCAVVVRSATRRWSSSPWLLLEDDASDQDSR